MVAVIAYCKFVSVFSSKIPVRVIGGGRKGVRPKLLPCTCKSPSYLSW